LLGHQSIAVAVARPAASATPAARLRKRQLLTKEILDRNIASVKVQLAKLLDFETKQKPRPARGQCLLDGQRFVSRIPARHRKAFFRQPDGRQGKCPRAHGRPRSCISYTEFSYMLLQAFDFYLLARDHNCELQIGGE